MDKFCVALFALKAHSYITKAQNQYFKALKENLQSDQAIVILDFAENYSFVVQDEVQGFHWNNDQCSIHPVAVYLKNEDGHGCYEKSLCIISDDRTHDVDFVQQVIKLTCKNINEISKSTVKKIFYFTDGCGGQYKNCKNFLNLCNHEKYFDISAEWCFFATSHGKNSCDGIGGSVKRTVARASLQRPFESQILSAEAVFQFCLEKMPAIKFEFLESATLVCIRATEAKRYKLAKTIPGTMGFHSFVPMNDANLSVQSKRISTSENISITHSFVPKRNRKPPNNTILKGYVLCQYDESFWIGYILKVNEQEKDCDIKFLHPQFPSRSYHWPHSMDLCSIPNDNIVANIELHTESGRQYKLNDKDMSNLVQQFLK